MAINFFFFFAGGNKRELNDYLLKINKELSYVQMEMRCCRNQNDGGVCYGLVNTVPDEQSKLGTKYSVPQIALFKGVVSVIVEFDLFWETFIVIVVKSFMMMVMLLVSMGWLCRPGNDDPCDHFTDACGICVLGVVFVGDSLWLICSLYAKMGM